MIMVQPIVCSDIKYLGVNGTISSNGHYEYPDVPPASHLLSLLQNKIKLNDWEFYQAFLQGVYVFPKNTYWKPINSYYYDVTYYKDRKDTLYGTDSFIRWIFPNYTQFAGYIENGFRNDDNTWTSLGRTNEALIAKGQGNNEITIDKEGVTFNYLGNVVSTNSIITSSKKADSAGHYQYPDIPPASYLLSSLQNKIKLNDWEFYQAYKQGVYVFPKKYVNNIVDVNIYYEVKYNNGNYKVQIVQHFLKGGYLNYQPILYDAFVDIHAGINDDNTWTATESDYIAKLGQTFDYLGNLVGIRMVDNSTSPATIRIPAPPLSEVGISINDINNQGWVETINSKKIKGWAANGTTPKDVEIYIDGDTKTNIYTVTPTLLRQDVADILNTTNKKFGWSFDIPDTDGNQKEGKHNVKVYFANSQMALNSNLPLFYVVPPPTPTPTPPPTPTPTPTPTTGGGGKNSLVSDLINKKGDTTAPKNLKPILIGLGIVILGLVAYKILKKK